MPHMRRDRAEEPPGGRGGLNLQGNGAGTVGLPVLSAAESADGSISACRNCSGTECCGILRAGGPIEPPFLTLSDIEGISRFTGWRPSQFCEYRVNPHTGDTVAFLKTRSPQACIFFDATDGRCGIFRSRPIDCRLFPLDVEERQGKYYWALYKHKTCLLRAKDRAALLRYGKRALALLRSEIRNYATVPVPGMNAIGYETLFPVECEGTQHD